MTPVRSEVTYMLVTLDRDYMRQKPDETWQRFYARRLVDYFKPASG